MKSSKEILNQIFEYDDYRVFLKDYFEAKKAESSFFSQRYFAKKAGFHAHNFCTMVLSGKRNLSVDSIQKIVKGIGLRGATATFFENLVFLNQANTIDEKEHYYERVKKSGKKTTFYQLHNDQFFFYEKWYYPVVRELMIMCDWHDDYSVLAKCVRPPISTAEAKDAVELLLKNGFVTKENGSYRATHAFVTSENVPDFIKKKARRDVLLKGIETIDAIAPQEKYAAYSTVTMSHTLYKEVRGILDETREKILALVAGEDKPDDVYEVVLQMFPVSHVNKLEKP